MGAPRTYPQELMDRGVRMVLESGRPVRHVAGDLGIHPEALRMWVKKVRADAVRGGGGVAIRGGGAAQGALEAQRRA
jgi:transposase-like protein